MSDEPLAKPESEIPLPDLYQGELDPEQLGALLVDLETHTTVYEVLVKGKGADFAQESEVVLRQAVAMLAMRTLMGISVRYHWDGQDWTDTLFWQEGRLKIVRMAGSGRPSGLLP